MKKIVLFLIVSTIWSCNQKTKELTENDKHTTELAEEAVPDLHHAQNALDWDGIYKGILPCADCEGIETTLELKKDLTFIIKETYLGIPKESTFKEQGTFTWNENGTTITLNDENRFMSYWVGEDTLTMLDLNGNKITGDLADMYILRK